MNRKGTEKPIEIFVALFIILAVALVMLKLFQGQITEQQKNIVDVQQENEQKELRDSINRECAQKCTAASNQGCSLAALASLCSYGSRNYLETGKFVDLNNDRIKNVDTTLLPGIGICEENIYCFHVTDSCCARKIDAASCKSILSDYWTQVGLAEDAVDVDTLLAKNVPFGSCSVDDEVTWSELAGWPE